MCMHGIKKVMLATTQLTQWQLSYLNQRSQELFHGQYPRPTVMCPGEGSNSRHLDWSQITIYAHAMCYRVRPHQSNSNVNTLLRPEWVTYFRVYMFRVLRDEHHITYLRVYVGTSCQELPVPFWTCPVAVHFVQTKNVQINCKRSRSL